METPNKKAGRPKKFECELSRFTLLLPKPMADNLFDLSKKSVERPSVTTLIQVAIADLLEKNGYDLTHGF